MEWKVYAESIDSDGKELTTYKTSENEEVEVVEIVLKNMIPGKIKKTAYIVYSNESVETYSTKEEAFAAAEKAIEKSITE